MTGQRTLLHALHVFRSFSLLDDEHVNSRSRAPGHNTREVSLLTDRQVVECAREVAIRAIPTLVDMLKVSLSPGHPQLTDDVVAALLACIRNATKGRKASVLCLWLTFFLSVVSLCRFSLAANISSPRERAQNRGEGRREGGVKTLEVRYTRDAREVICRSGLVS